MAIYIEYVIIDNLIMNMLILNLTNKMLKLNAKKFNIFLSAALGTIFAIFLPYIKLNTYLLFLIKMFFGLIMVVILKKVTNFKKLLATYVWFLGFTFILGGLCFGLLYMFNFKTSINGIIIGGFEIPVSLFLLLILFYVYLLSKSLHFIKRNNTVKNFTYNLVIKLNNQTYHLEGFLDSGNRLYDNGKPLVILSKKVFDKILSSNLSSLNLENDFKDAHYITVKSINGSKKILVINVDELFIFKNETIKSFKNTPVAISNTNFSGEFDCLLHTDLLD